MRDSYLDILKGLGIIFVVMAHANIFAREINWFHLELFFFVSGFLLNPKKCMDYGEFFLHKLKTLWKIPIGMVSSWNTISFPDNFGFSNPFNER